MHPAKRPYAGTHSQGGQSTITAFFPRASASSSAAANGPPAPPPAPELPASVQANLLSVGMRVRKSVPEGYKTGGYSALGLFADAAQQRPPPDAARDPQHQQTLRAYRAVQDALGGRELMPFCGILKTGGYAQQSERPAAGALPHDDGVLTEDDLPWLSSQGSTATDVSVPDAIDVYGNGGIHKRRLAAVADGDDDGDVLHVLDERETAGRGITQRLMATPSSRRKRAGYNEAGVVMTDGVGVVKASRRGAEDQENMVDFGEAAFLDYDVFGDVDMADG